MTRADLHGLAKRGLTVAERLTGYADEAVREAAIFIHPYVVKVASITWRSLKSVASSLRRNVALAVAWVAEAAGPVANSVRGELNKDEVKKVIHKTWIGMATGSVASIHALMTDPDVQAILLGPLFVGLIFGFLAYLHHKGDGTDPAAVTIVVKPETTADPAAIPPIEAAPASVTVTTPLAPEQAPNA